LNRFSIIGIGEFLWDLFPEGEQLGGAPANFAYITSLLGDSGIVASRIGDDHRGVRAREKLQKWGLDSSTLQQDSLHPTGTVQVQVDSHGNPKYEIALPVAWDFLEITAAWRDLATRADAVCFGTLAQRSMHSRRTILEFLRLTSPQSARVFDVNLRQSFYNAEIIRESLAHANVLKLNHEELPIVAALLGSSFESEPQAAQWLRRHFSLRLVCLTRGVSGSLLVAENALHEHRGFKVSIADTVGAGDAFTAALVHHLLRGSSLSAMNEAANRAGSWVASQVGATPAPDAQILQEVRSPAARQ
jgi:fructokinase